MNSPLEELSVTFIPLDLVTEWARCGQTADYIARFLAYDFDNREHAGNVLSTVINELIENAVKFSTDKSQPAEIFVRQFGDYVSIITRNSTSEAQAASFRETAERIVAGDPESLFAEQILHPPETGGAGIGLIMLRKDYDAQLNVRIGSHDGRAGLRIVHVELTVSNREVESR